MLDSNFILNTIRGLRETESLMLLRDQVGRLMSLLPRSADDQEVRLVRGELDQIAASQTLERARYYLHRFEKSMTAVRTAAVNDINLNRWKEYDDVWTDSLWLLKRRDNTGVHSADYWGNFVPQIPVQLMRRYTRAGEWVLDPFLGSGTTLIECQRLGRNGMGIELQSSVLERSRHAIDAEANPHQVQLIAACGDSSTFDLRGALVRAGATSVQLAVLHPPYHDIIKFSEDPRCLSNTASVDGFLDRLMEVVENCARVLDRKRYLALVLGDKYMGGDWIPLGFLAMNRIIAMGFRLKSIIVKNFEETTGKRRQKELWRYRALSGGFYIFKHEYIFLFRRR